MDRAEGRDSSRGWPDSGTARPLLRRWFVPLSVRAFVILTCALMIVLTVAHDWQSRNAALRSVQTVNRSLAHSLAQHAEDSFNAADAVLVAIMAQLDRGAQGLDSRAQLGRNLAAMVAQSESLTDLSVFDADGNLILSSVATPPKLNVENRSFFQHHVSNPDSEPYLGSPITSPSRANWRVTVSRRLERADHQFAGVVAASLNSLYFERHYRALDLGPETAISAFRTDGTLLFRYPGVSAYLVPSYANSGLFRSWSPSHFAGVLRYTALADGLDRVAAYDTSSRFPVIVNVAASVHEALADWRRETLWDLAGYGLLAGVVLWLGNRLARQSKLQKLAERRLTENELQFRLLTEMSGDMVTRVGADGRRLYVSPASTKLLGWAAEQLVGSRALHSCNADDSLVTEAVLRDMGDGIGSDVSVTYRALHRLGHEIWIEANVRMTYDPDTGRSNGAVMISRDITARKTVEAGLKSLATTDGLTGIANRRRLDEVLQSEWRRSAREGTALSIALIDVDLFKSYNDQYGHLAGDDCLRQLAQTLNTVFRRPGDLLARYGGEEFGAVLPSTEAPGAWDVAEAARDAVEKCGLIHDGNPLSKVVTISVGVATAYPMPDRDVKEGLELLLRTADKALYESKRTGRNQVKSIQVLSPPILHGSFHSVAGH